MNSDKMTARIAGLLFFVATITFATGSGLLDSIINAPDYLMNLYPNRTQMIIGMLLEFVDAIAVIGISVLLFPILKRYSETVAISYVAFRVFEGIVLAIGIISPLLLVTLSQKYMNAGEAELPYFQTLGTLAIKGHYLAYQIAMIALGIGSLFFCYLLYKTKLIPRSISIFAFIGYVSLIIGAVLEVFGYSVGLMFSMPGMVGEIVLPIWLIVKGFNHSLADTLDINR